MVRLKFPITPFSLCSQSNPTPKTRSLTPLMFFKFDFTSSLTEVAANHPIVLWQSYWFRLFVRSYVYVDRWKSYFPQICYGCGGEYGRDDASSGGGGWVCLDSWVDLEFWLCWVSGLCLGLWLIVMMWAISFSAAFVRVSFAFSKLVCCPLRIGILDVLLMSLIVMLKFI
ncbi:unnamed protein product [Prunus brigantina]